MAQTTKAQTHTLEVLLILTCLTILNLNFNLNKMFYEESIGWNYCFI